MDRKNTILLTVIAIATLLVAVVGATFAFFTSQNTGKADTNVNVETETVNTSTFYEGNAINLLANMSNFAEAQADVREEGTYGESEPYVKYQGGNGDAVADMCYSATLVVTKNDFDYSAANPGTGYDAIKNESNSKVPELVLELTKATGKHATPEEVVEEGQAITVIEKLDYMQAAHKIYSTGELKQTAGGGDVTIQGFDITRAGKDGTLQYRIPNAEAAVKGKDGSFDDTDFVFKIQANGGETVIDKWNIKAYIVNYNFDQSDNAGTYSEESGTTTPKEFKAAIHFESVDCNTGASTAGED